MAEDLPQQTGWLTRMRSGLARSSDKLAQSITGVFTKTRLDREQLDDLEEALIASDLGVATAAKVRSQLESQKFDRGISEADVRAVLAETIASVLAPLAKPLDVIAKPRPHIILVVGVNGTGKTTTIAKLGHWFQEQDYSVLFAAGDTFRAAAIEQLQIWGDRLGIPVLTTKVGGDAAGLAYEAVEKARASGRDVLLIDTAGRLQNKQDLMAELAKVKRVVQKLSPDGPHDVVLVLDATTGQNALNQIAVFREIAGVTGLVMTKLDGTARGGVLVAAAERFGLPIHAIGVGETIDDLKPFSAQTFANALAGVTP
jgi:fused signal recognition particle receptor